ncbi:hypothetical protein KIN20_035034 [Parelaphostrongylus tenuis]|uniref:Uncharacterized protein n=1 Tax=Parelaphostrongylus tenuis TaxID=148309 RepID=A0AAD5RAJ5_PARTN|nr:hypothetical protein KIN20_035034 [Parelaphostrongylus tenuis]
MKEFSKTATCIDGGRVYALYQPAVFAAAHDSLLAECCWRHDDHFIKKTDSAEYSSVTKNTMMILSHEVISIGLIAFVCVSFAIFCGLIWLLRCRRIQQQFKEDGNDRRTDSLKDDQPNKVLSKRAVSDAVMQPKRAETEQHDETSETEKPKGSANSPEQQIERKDANSELAMRPIQPCQPKQLERIKNESRPAEKKCHDTISMRSIVALERNDSKVNVFPAERIDDIDYNPGLNNLINLETI